jgi:uncharacterized membrane protein
MDLLLYLYLGAGGLLILLAVPMLLKKLRPNSFYGVRVSKTLNDPEAWYAANAYAARYLLATGASIMLAAVGFYFMPGLGVDGYAWACLAVFGVVFGWGLVKIARFVRRL